MYVSFILNMVVSAVADAEYGAAYTNGKAAEDLHITLGLLPTTTLIVIDNQCLTGIANDSVTLHNAFPLDPQPHSLIH